MAKLIVPWKGYTYYQRNLTGEKLAVYNQLLEGILNWKDSIELQTSLDIKSVFQIYTMIQRDWPSLYHITNEFHYRVTRTTTIIPRYTMTEAEYQRQYTKVVEFLNRTAQKLGTRTDFDKIRILHDTIRRHVVYHDSSTPNEHNILGAIVDRKAVCESIAKTYKLMCDIVKIPCIVVFGYSGNPHDPNLAMATSTVSTTSEDPENNHAWNLVYLKDTWYHVDVTHDLLKPYRNGDYPFCYDYFLRSEPVMRSTHRASRFLPIPESLKDFGLYKRTGYQVSSDKELVTQVQKSLKENKQEIVFELAPEYNLPQEDIAHKVSIAVGLLAQKRISYFYRADVRVFRALL